MFVYVATIAAASVPHLPKKMTRFILHNTSEMELCIFFRLFLFRNISAYGLLQHTFSPLLIFHGVFHTVSNGKYFHQPKAASKSMGGKVRKKIK
jgi:hypothetical protein